MDTQKNDEKNIVLELKHQLGRMMVQVDYMYRNDREMSRLDLDIMMERTRDLYDLLCDYQADNVGANQNLPDIDIHEDDEQIHHDVEINEGGELINRDVEFEIETPADVLNENEVIEEDKEDKEDKIDKIDKMDEEEPVVEGNPEPDEEKHEEIKHVLDVSEDDEDEEDWEDEDDEVFHVEQPVEEKPVEEDNSLAARLHRTHIDDIRMAMGINDKIMIVNDLFMGSVERYNKSIDALNDFPTLSGARVYMSELQIELQWDTESEAYKLLNDMVERRFV